MEASADAAASSNATSAAADAAAPSRAPDSRVTATPPTAAVVTGAPKSRASGAMPTTSAAAVAAASRAPDSLATATPPTAAAVTGARPTAAAVVAGAPTSRAPVGTPVRPALHGASALQVAPAAPAKPPHRILITITVMLASFMQTLDNTIANVALPRMQGSLSATQDQMTWVLTSYIVAAAIMTPLSGWLAGQIGRRRVFVSSIIGFTIASALCGLAQSLPEIIIARLLQGLCGAALVPMSQAVLLDINPPEKHARAMSIWVMAVTVGPILGPALGGWLTDNYNWRWVFYINLPFGILALIGTLSFLSETPRKKSRFDFFGFATLSLAIGALQVMLDRGQLQDWFSSTEIWITAAFAAVSFYLLVVHTLTTKQAPFVSPGLFKDRNFLAGCLFMAVVGVVLFATLALLPPLLQDLMNYPVVLTGLVTAPRGFGTFASMFLVQWLMRHKWDVRIIIAIGFVITAVALWQMTGFYLQMDRSIVVWSGFLQGLGSGMVYVPLASLAFATLVPALRNEGTAIFSLVRNIGSSIGIAVVTTMLTRNTQMMHSRLAESVTPYFDPWHPVTPVTGAGVAMVNQTVTTQATMIAYNNNFEMMMIMTLCVIPLLAFMRTAKKGSGDAPVVVE